MAMRHIENHGRYVMSDIRHHDTPPEPVPISHLKPPEFTADEAIALLAEVLDEMGRMIADLRPADGFATLRLARHQTGRVGWLEDGTPVVYL